MIRSYILISLISITQFAVAGQPEPVVSVTNSPSPQSSDMPAAFAESLRATLKELKHLGSVNPYHVFAGRFCDNCDEDIAIHLIKPDGNRAATFVYPGKIIDPKTKNVVLDSRAFFGRCIPAIQNEVYVVFQKERVDRRHGPQSSVLVAEPREGLLYEKLLERRLPRIDQTLKYVRKKICYEVPIRNRRMTDKTISLKPRRSYDDDDDKEEDK
ncbi:MAG: hypothetical protein AABZ06_03075 [Bdellovibrionota bacterium]